MNTSFENVIQVVGPGAKLPKRADGVLTVLLHWGLPEVRAHIDKYLTGARLKQIGRYCAVQHPSFAEFGEQGLYDVAFAHKLPLIGVIRARAI